MIRSAVLKYPYNCRVNERSGVSDNTILDCRHHIIRQGMMAANTKKENAV